MGDGEYIGGEKDEEGVVGEWECGVKGEGR